MMVLHDSYGRDARHEACRATEHVLVKSMNRARHPPVLVGWEMSENFRGMNQTDPTSRPVL